MGRILLIEDDTDIRESLEEMLKHEGHEVTSRKDGRGVSQLVRKRNFDVIITDLKLPGTRGIDLIRKIKSHRVDSEIIIITGFGTLDSVIEALQIGVYDYVRKPFEPMVFLNTVRHAIEKADLKRERARALEEIRSLKNLNEEILESSTDGIIVLDREIVCQYWNAAAERLSDISREEVLGKNLLREKVWVLGNFLPEQYQEVFNGNVAEKVITAASPERKRRRLRQKLSPLRDPEGKVKGILVLLTDVTQMKTAELKKEELGHRRELDLRQITCLYNITKDGETAGSLEEFLRASAAHIEDAIGPGDRMKVHFVLNGFSYCSKGSEGDDSGFSTPVGTEGLGDGELRVATGGAALSQSDKELLRSAAERISEVISRREAGRRAVESRRMASLGTLAGGLAHNLNNLLGGILGYTSFIKSQTPNNTPLYTYLNTIEESSDLAARITSNLLEISGSPNTPLNVMNINDNLKRIIGLMRIFFDRNIIISTRFEPDLRRVQGDSSGIDRVLLNIFLNAREALQAGGRLIIETSNLEIEEGTPERTMALRPGMYIRITFTDNGPGMDEQSARHCFDPFYSTKGLGYGLGLSTAYGTVRGHGGHMEIHSKPRTGTRATIYLPAMTEEAEEENELKDPLAANMTVLVADDEELIRKMVSDGLGKLGYKVITAGNGDEAVSTFRGQADDIDAVLLDLIMPGMEYREVFDKIRRIRDDARIILSSGYRLPDGARDMVSDRGALFIQKPYRLNELSKLVLQAIRSAGKKDPGKNAKGKRENTRRRT